MIHITILASGGGTNAAQIINRFEQSNLINVSCIITNNQQAGVIKVAEDANVPWYYFSNSEFNSGKSLLKFLEEQGIQWLILAGFLRKIPGSVVNAYENRIINIHPALLPKYAGKGMYGKNVHEAVLKAREVESGITIHFVNENFDEGEIIFQKNCLIDQSDDVDSLAKKVQQLEHEYFPQVIENVVLGKPGASTDKSQLRPSENRYEDRIRE